MALVALPALLLLVPTAAADHEGLPVHVWVNIVVEQGPVTVWMNEGGAGLCLGFDGSDIGVGLDVDNGVVVSFPFVGPGGTLPDGVNPPPPADRLVGLGTMYAGVSPSC